MDHVNGDGGDLVVVLETLYRLAGGDAVLLPLPRGEKAPRFRAWQNVTLETTQSEPYLRALLKAVRDGGNLGVLLGPRSHNLVTVDVDDDDELARFLALNLPLQGSLRTRGARGGQVWLQMPSGVWYPQQTHPLKYEDGRGFGEWRGGGCQSVIWGRHPSGVDYRRVVEAPAIEYSFDLIQWPEGLVLPWPAQTRVDADRLDDFIRNRVEEVCERFLSNGHKDGKVWRLGGDNGRSGNSLVIELQGPKAGRWFDHGAAKGGWLTGLLQSVHKWGFRQMAAELERAFGAELFVARSPNGAQPSTNATPGDVRGAATPPPPAAPDETAHRYQDRPRVAQAEEERCPYPPVDWDALTKSADPARAHYQHKAVYPEDSIIEEFMRLGRETTESADCYLLGAVLPVVAALLSRRVHVPWSGGEGLYANVFHMLAGPPAAGKTGAIKLARRLAKRALPPNFLLPKRFSPEAMFDQFDAAVGGNPDKLWLVDEAKMVLADWIQTSHGARVAADILDLYDCPGLDESFLRNKKKEGGKALREVPETSTSILFGAVFSAAAFQGTLVADGMNRRFAYYIAERRARAIDEPPPVDVTPLAAAFAPLQKLIGPMARAPQAQALWRDYRRALERRMDEAGHAQEALQARLGTATGAVMKVATHFEACRAACRGLARIPELEASTLEMAIAHVEENLRASAFLDRIAQRAVTRQQAEIVLAIVRKEFRRWGNAVYASKSDLTRRLCHNPGRKGTLTTDELYFQVIPYLESCGEATLALKKGKLEVYAFRPEDHWPDPDDDSGERPVPDGPNSPSSSGGGGTHTR